MKVFISWSGAQGKNLGEAIRNWLPLVLQNLKPYFTPDDIEKGGRWSAEIAKELDESIVGIICLTKESLSSPWVMFEAGALSKKLDKSRVCPILFGIENSDVKGPLVQFQTTPFSKNEMGKLIRNLNDISGESKLQDAVRDEVFETWWPKLEEKIFAILKSKPDTKHEILRPDRELIEEILELARQNVRRNSHSNINPKAAYDLVENYNRLRAAVIVHNNIHQSIEIIRDMEKQIRHIGFRFPDIQMDLIDKKREPESTPNREKVDPPKDAKYVVPDLEL